MPRSAADVPPDGLRISNGQSTLEWRGGLNGNWVMVGSPEYAKDVPYTSSDDKIAQQYRADSDQMDQLVNMSRQFMQHNRSTPTGGVLALPGASNIAQALPGTSDDLEPMNNLSVQMATGLRKPGMRLTQMEFGKFLGAVPNPRSTYEQNSAAADGFERARVMAKAKSVFYNNWLNVHRSLGGQADAAWQTYLNQHFGSDGTYYDDPKAKLNAGLKAQSAQAPQSVGGYQVQVVP